MLSPPYWIFAENFPKAGRIGKSFLVLLGCPSGRYYLGTGTQQITCLQRGWRCIQNGGYGENGEKNWVRDAKVKINKMAEKLKFSSRKNRKNRHVLHVRVLGIRQSVRGLVFAVHCFFFVILKLRLMGLSVLDCRTPYR